MYAIETAKLSSKGQMVIPDSFRKRYGWVPGALRKLRISLPVGIENSDARMKAILEKHG